MKFVQDDRLFSKVAHSFRLIAHEHSNSVGDSLFQLRKSRYAKVRGLKVDKLYAQSER